MSRPDKIYKSIIAKIGKNILQKKYSCLAPNCEDRCINSHLLQKNGVLDTISEEGMLIELRATGIFNSDKKGALNFKPLGKNKSLSLPLFCNKHDTEFFKSIEQEKVDFHSYHTQCLFSYRSLCGELREKHRSREMNDRVIQSQKLREFELDYRLLEIQNQGLERGVKEFNYFKEEFEKEILGEPAQRFVFRTFKYPLLKVAAAAMFTPIHDMKKLYEDSQKGIYSEKINEVFINIIPRSYLKNISSNKSLRKLTVRNL